MVWEHKSSASKLAAELKRFTDLLKAAHGVVESKYDNMIDLIAVGKEKLNPETEESLQNTATGLQRWAVVNHHLASALEEPWSLLERQWEEEVKTVDNKIKDARQDLELNQDDVEILQAWVAIVKRKQDPALRKSMSLNEIAWKGDTPDTAIEDNPLVHEERILSTLREVQIMIEQFRKKLQNYPSKNIPGDFDDLISVVRHERSLMNAKNSEMSRVAEQVVKDAETLNRHSGECTHDFDMKTLPAHIGTRNWYAYQDDHVFSSTGWTEVTSGRKKPRRRVLPNRKGKTPNRSSSAITPFARVPKPCAPPNFRATPVSLDNPATSKVMKTSDRPSAWAEMMSNASTPAKQSYTRDREEELKEEDQDVMTPRRTGME